MPVEASARVPRVLPQTDTVAPGTLVSGKKAIWAGQENLNSQEFFLPSDIRSKLWITVTAGPSSTVSLQPRCWKIKTVPLRGVGEPNHFLSSLALIPGELPVFCANIAHSQSWNRGLTLSDSAGWFALLYGISNRKEFSFLSRKWT